MTKNMLHLKKVEALFENSFVANTFKTCYKRDTVNMLGSCKFL